MKLVYTNENRFLVNNAKNILENAGFEISLKNEYAAGGVGELAVFETWLELWVVEDEDYKRAKLLIETAFNKDNSEEWVCRSCHEKNDASFDMCWKCQRDKNAINENS